MSSTRVSGIGFLAIIECQVFVADRPQGVDAYVPEFELLASGRECSSFAAWCSNDQFGVKHVCSGNS